MDFSEEKRDYLKRVATFKKKNEAISKLKYV